MPAAVCRTTTSALYGGRPVPADGAEPLRRLPDEHPHLHRGDGGDRPRLRVHGLGGQPDQRLRVAGRAVSRSARSSDVWGANARRVGRRIARAATARPSPVDGGWRVTGRWPWASGCLHAQWAACGIHMKGTAGRDGEPRAVADADGRGHDRGHVVHGRHEGHRQQHDRGEGRVRARAPLPAVSAGVRRDAIAPSTSTKRSIARRSCRSPC